MFNRMTFKGLLAAAALVVGLSGTVQAATVTFSALGAPTPFVFASSITGTVIQNDAVNQSGVRVGPRPSGTAPYTSVQANSSATYDFGSSLKNALTIVWGTPDTYNFIDFYRGTTLLETLAGFGSGGNITNPTALIQNIGDGLGFTSVVFRSVGQNAFEYEFVGVAQVPVPAAGFLLIGALGGLAALRRRKALAA